jgi:hypothetical protein
MPVSGFAYTPSARTLIFNKSLIIEAEWSRMEVEIYYMESRGWIVPEL